MTFHDTRQRLVAQVRARLHNGELTERALARYLGISQPHVNNVLQGRRKLSPEVADLMLNFFHCSLLDLYAEFELRTNLHGRAVPDGAGHVADVLKRPVGPGNEWAGAIDGRRYRTPWTVASAPECLLFARLAPDRRMAASLCGSDIALLDTSISARLVDCPTAIYLVCRRPDTMLRWIRGGFRNLYVVDEGALNRPLEWERLAMRENQRLEYVKGRVLWIGAEQTLCRA